MKTALITGSAGLIGSESARFFFEKGYAIIGIDNDMRKYFFGAEGSTEWNREKLARELGKGYTHYAADIREKSAIEEIVKKHKLDIVIHTAAQPSHDWAAKEPYTDFSVNADGTLVMLESTRQFAPEAAFIFMSTNKVYEETRWEVDTLTGKKGNITYSDEARIGAHIWYVSDLTKFKSHYPASRQTYSIDDLLQEMCVAAQK